MVGFAQGGCSGGRGKVAGQEDATSMSRTKFVGRAKGAPHCCEETFCCFIGSIAGRERHGGNGSVCYRMVLVE